MLIRGKKMMSSFLGSIKTAKGYVSGDKRTVTRSDTGRKKKEKKAWFVFASSVFISRIKKRKM
jgi:hypothetical protein